MIFIRYVLFLKLTFTGPTLNSSNFHEKYVRCGFLLSLLECLLLFLLHLKMLKMLSHLSVVPDAVIKKGHSAT